MPAYSPTASRFTRLLSLLGLAALLLAGANAWAQQQVAGRVVFATGNPTAIDAGGAERNLARGDDVFAGDSLVTTANGRLQVSFIDGAYISVQPGSEYRIEEYEYAGQPDGTESAIYRLIKGGVRALTGLIGEENKEAYKVRSSAATIGIRGTGHNTRVCQGDCAGLQDGLYHNTWEGITYVFNNADTVEVPAGRGVYVRNLNAPIRFLSQPPGVTAVETARQRERQQREEEDQNTLISAGDQRNDRGDQRIVAGDGLFGPGASGVLLNQVMVGVSPETDADDVDGFAGADVSVFTTDAGFVGALLTEETEDGVVRTIGTINPDALLGGDDPDSVAEARAILALADPVQVELFRADPASPVESTINPVGLGWGRWAGGNALVVDNTGRTEVQGLTNNQSIHFIFGPEPASIPSLGRAVYEFIGGTRSTSLSGATIGAGVTGGFIGVDFAASDAFINMDVSHNNSLYAVSGELGLDAAVNRLFSQLQGVFATTDLSGSACLRGCPVNIDGRFTYPASGGVPGNIGLQYAIRETDPITGVAGFHRTPTTPGTVTAGLGMAALGVTEVQGTTAPLFDQAGDGFGFFNPAEEFIGFVGSPGTAAPSQVIGDPIEQPLQEPLQTTPGRYLFTIDPDAVLGGDNIIAATEAGGLLARADAALLADFRADPAGVAESVTDPSRVGWGRWTDGRVLAVGDTGQTELIELSGNQSFHHVFGPEPVSIPGVGSGITASYGLLGGTRSTSLSGATIGTGVDVGLGADLSVNFGTGTASLYLPVQHAGTTYEINGSLNIDGINNRITHVAGGTNTFVSNPPQSSICSNSCTSLIDGRFFGPMDGAVPGKAGLNYLIQENDSISGAAVLSSDVLPPG